MPRFQPPFSRLAPPAPTLRASVVVPARDEECSIGRTLDALADSRDEAGAPLDPRSFEVLLLCNNCRDETAAAARVWARQRPMFALHVVEAFLPRAQANIGTVRRLLMDAACARLESLPEGASPRFIASTDADTRVEPLWLWANERELRAGAWAVGGRVLVDNDGDPATRKTYLLDTAYRLLAARLECALDPQPLDSWPRHFQFFGASLCLTPRAYRAVGGLPRVTQLEDMALERALLRADIPLRHSPRVRVHTSARQSGRVTRGLSSQLEQWSDLRRESGAWLVPSAHEIAWRARLKSELFALRGAGAEEDVFQTPSSNDGAAHQAKEDEAARSNRARPREEGERSLENIALALGLPLNEVRSHLCRAHSFGGLWDDLWSAAWQRPALRARWAPVPVEVALSQLRALLALIARLPGA